MQVVRIPDSCLSLRVQMRNLIARGIWIGFPSEEHQRDLEAWCYENYPPMRIPLIDRQGIHFDSEEDLLLCLLKFG